MSTNIEPQPINDDWWSTFDPNEATIAERRGYISWCTLLYRHRFDVKGYSTMEIHDLLVMDFEGWTVRQLESAGKKYIYDLRHLLRELGIYVKKEARYNIAQALLNAVQSDVPMEWPADDLERPSTPTAERPSTPTAKRPSTPTPAPAPQIPNRPVNQEKADQTPHPLTVNTALLVASRISTQELLQDTRVATNSQVDYLKQITAIAKLYTGNEDKYSGDIRESFDSKYRIFINYVKMAALPYEGIAIAFPTMLRGIALNFYHAALEGRDLSIEELIDKFKQRFETEERIRLLVSEWNSASIETTIAKNTDKSMINCLDILVRDLTDLQTCLPHPMRQPYLLRDQLLKACNLPIFKVARLKPAETLMGVVGDLQTAIQTEAQTNPASSTALYYANCGHDHNPNDSAVDAFYTDRKYHQRPARGRPSRDNFGRAPSRSRTGKNLCWVCGKDNCISYNHTDFERMKARRHLDQRQQQLGEQHLRTRQFLLQADDELSRELSQDDDSIDPDRYIMDSVNQDGIPEVTLTTPAENTTNYLVAVATQDQTSAVQLVSTLSDRSLAHALTHRDNLTHPTTYTLENSRPSRYGVCSSFMGILIDTGAAKFSTAGSAQFDAYCRDFSLSPIAELDGSKAGAVVACFGIGTSESIGTATVQSPIGDVIFHIVEAETPFLLSMADMDRLGVVFNNLTNHIVKPSPGNNFATPTMAYPVVRQFGHPFLVWGPTAASYLSEVELRRLHRRFGHPSSSRLLRLIERAGYNEPWHQQLLKRIGRFCRQCQRHGQSPRRFRFTLSNGDARFNYTVLVDVMYINSSPVLHVIDEATSFQAARFLSSMTAEAVWEALRVCWIDTYIGPPDICVHDAGTNFRSVTFQDNCQALGIRTKCIPVEAPQSIGKLERYHGPLRRAFEVICDDYKALGVAIHKTAILQMAVKAVNDTAGPDGLVPTLLVFGAYPRLSPDSPSPTITERAESIKKAMTEVANLHAQRQVREALARRNGPDTGPLQNVPIGSDVWVWRTHQKEWQGPYKLLSQEDETCIVQLPGGPTEFRSTAVKPYHQDIDDSSDHKEDTAPEDNPPDEQPRRSARERIPSRRAREAQDIGTFLTKTATAQEVADGLFDEAQRKEIYGLIEGGVFDVADASSIPKGTRIFKSRFVNEWKAWGTEDTYAKSRWVVQAYNDSEKKTILTQAPTVQRVSIRLLLCIATILQLAISSRDISQAYTQSLTKVARDIYIYPPTGLGLAKGQLLKIVWPLYGLPEAGTHWVNTYLAYYKDQLNMRHSAFDACLLANTEDEATGFIAVQVDDTLIAANKQFLVKEAAELQKAGFLSKPLEHLIKGSTLRFNGINVKQADEIIVTQEQQIHRLEPITTEKGSLPSMEKLSDKLKQEYIAQRARGAYIAASCQPERSFDYAYAAQYPDPTYEQLQKLNTAIEWQKNNETRGIRYTKLDVETLQIVIFTDSSFANNEDMSSQIGYVIVIVDDSGRANVVDWKSIKSRRVTRSVLAAELYAMAQGFDIGVAIKSTMDDFLRTSRCNDPIPLVLATDSQSLYDCLTKLGTTKEKRLMVDIMSLREGYQRQVISEIWRIDSSDNPADAMTKAKANGALTQLLNNNKLDINLLGWVTRDR